MVAGLAITCCNRAARLLKNTACTNRTGTRKRVACRQKTRNWIKAQYFKPYLMHGSIGPSSAVAIYDNKQLHVWSHPQGIFPLRSSHGQIAEHPGRAGIHVTGMPGSGCYGHNGADDVAADVALLAMAYPGKHIRLQWTRSDEHGWEPYGSAMIMQLAAVIDSAGNINSWQYEPWSDTHSIRAWRCT